MRTFTKKKALECLIKARETLTKRDNWTQGTMELEGMHCAVGALRQACLKTAYPPEQQLRNSPRYKIAINTLANQTTFFPTVFGETGDALVSERDVIRWNDAADTTHTAILQGFDKAIAALEAEIADEENSLSTH